MDQTSRLIFDVIGRDRGGGKVLSDAAEHADNAHDSLQKLGGTLSGLGGPFAQVDQVASSFGDTLSTVHDRGDSFVGMLTGVGLGLTAAGVALIGFREKEKNSQVQLQNAVANTGASYSDYQGRVEESVRSQEQFGHAADDTMDALTALTIASQDPAKAINDLGLATEIAANKHESLADAAKQLVLIEQGSTRGLKAFGIELDGQGEKAGQVNRALKELSDRLAGSASAAADTYAGRIKAVEARTEDFLASVGRYGEWVTAVGGGITSLVAIYELLAASKAKNVATDTTLIASETQLAAAQSRVAATATAENAAIGRGAMFGRAGLLKAGLYAGGGYAAGQVAQAGLGGTAGSVASNVLTGAGVGAGIGSIVPGVGTLVGAGVGAAIGGGVAVAGMFGPHADPAEINRLAQTEKGYHELQDRLHQLQAVEAKSSGLGHELAQKSIEQARAALDAGKANHQYAKSLLEEAKAADKARISIDGQVAALQDSVGAALAVSDAEDGLQLAMHNLAQSVHDGSHSLDGHSLAAESNRDALRNLAKQELEVIESLRKHGVHADKVRASALAMSRAIQRNATDILGNKKQVDAFLKSLGILPEQIARTLGATEIYSEKIGEDVMKSLGAGIQVGTYDAVQSAAYAGAAVQKQLRLSAGLDSAPGAGGSFVPKDDKAVKAAHRYGKHLADTVVDAYAPPVVEGVDKATEDALTAAERRFQREKQRMEQALSEITGAYRAQRDQIAGGFDITSLPDRSDLFGDSYGPASIRSSARQFAKELETWAHLYARLQRRGLNDVMLSQIEAAGVDAIPAMREILHGGRKEIRSLNVSERRIHRAAGDVAERSVEGEYGPEIARLLQKLPPKLAHELAKELRHVHIHVSVDDVDHKQGHRVVAG